MFIRCVEVKGKAKTYRYAQLVESFRRPKDARPTHRVVANLGQLSDQQVTLIRRAFDTVSPNDAAVLPHTAAAPLSALSIQQNLQYLDIAVGYEAWRRFGLGKLLDELAPRGNAEMSLSEEIAILTSHRCVAPDSKLAAERWVPETAWPELLGIQPGRFHNTRIHRALSALESNTEELQRRLPALYRADEPRFAALFLDVTDTWFVGRGPPVAEKAITKEGFYEYAIGIVLLCNEHGFPLRWDVVRARCSDSTVMETMLQKVRELDWAREVPIVMDRIMGKTATLQKVASTGLRFVTALTKQEFDTYAEAKIPWQAIAAIDAGAPDAAAQAAEAVVRAGMQRVNETRYVRDLGVVELKLDEHPVSQSALDPSSRLAEALQLARKAHTDVAEGRARDYRTAARSLRLSSQRLSEYIRLLDLAPELQEEVLAGRARMSLRSLVEIARKSSSEAQRLAFAEENEKKHLVRDKASKTASSARPPPQPLRLRVVVVFNPSLFVGTRLAADETLGKLRAFEREQNERLQSTHSRRTRDSVYAEVNQELRHRQLLETFEIHIEEENGRPVRVELRLNEKAWQRRRRFDGFNVVVAHPDALQDAAELSSLYREKNCVEQDFRHIKSEIELRPMWHHTDAKVRAHVTLCMLALLVDRLLERALTKAGRPMTAKVLYERLQNVRLNRCHVKGAKEGLYLLTTSSPDTEAILAALEMTHLIDSEAVTRTVKPR